MEIYLIAGGLICLAVLYMPIPWNESASRTKLTTKQFVVGSVLILVLLWPVVFFSMLMDYIWSQRDE